MAIHGPLTAATIWFGGYDFSCVTNELEFNATREALKTTTFCSAGVNTYTGGMYDLNAHVHGLTEYGTGLADDTLATSIAANPQTHVLCVSPTGADGTHADFASVNLLTYSPLSGMHGQLAEFDANFAGRDAYGRVGGTILLPKQVLPSGATTGTFAQLGAVSSTQSIYAALQVFAVTGTTPTLDVVVKSAATSGGSYTTRASFSQQTAAGDVFLTPVAGAVTDTFWKVTATVGGSASPTVTAAVLVGIR